MTDLNIPDRLFDKIAMLGLDKEISGHMLADNYIYRGIARFSIDKDDQYLQFIYVSKEGAVSVTTYPCKINSDTILYPDQKDPSRFAYTAGKIRDTDLSAFINIIKSMTYNATYSDILVLSQYVSNGSRYIGKLSSKLDGNNIKELYTFVGSKFVNICDFVPLSPDTRVKDKEGELVTNIELIIKVFVDRSMINAGAMTALTTQNTKLVKTLDTFRGIVKNMSIVAE